MTTWAARYGRAQAYERWREAGRAIWWALLPGFALMSVLNLVVLVASWGAYRRPLLVLGAWAALSGCAAAVWQRSRSGLDLPAVALVLAVTVCCQALVVAQLPAPEVLGRADFATGMGALPLALVPFSRPVEEVAACIGGLVVAAALLLSRVPATLANEHLLVISGGSGATIVLGSAVLVGGLRRILRREGQLRQAALEQHAYRRAREGLDSRLRRQAHALDGRAADVLEGLADGRLDPQDPHTVDRCHDIATDLRSELGLRSRRGWLQALLLDDAERRGLPQETLEAVDDDGVMARLPPSDRQLVHRAVIDAAEAGAASVLLTLLRADGPDRAVVIVRVEGCGVPTTTAWQQLRRRAAATLSEVTGARWFYDAEFALQPSLTRRPTPEDP